MFIEAHGDAPRELELQTQRERKRERESGRISSKQQQSQSVLHDKQRDYTQWHTHIQYIQTKPVCSYYNFIYIYVPLCSDNKQHNLHKSVGSDRNGSSDVNVIASVSVSQRSYSYSYSLVFGYFLCCLCFSECCRCFLRHMHVRFTVEIFDQFKFFICNEHKQVAPKRAKTKQKSVSKLLFCKARPSEKRARANLEKKRRNTSQYRKTATC